MSGREEIRQPPRASGLPALLSAVGNACAGPLDPNLVIDALRTGEGSPSLLRALFGDAGLVSLDRAAASAGIGRPTLLAAYARARATAAAANPELDALLQAETSAGAAIGFTGAEPT